MKTENMVVTASTRRRMDLDEVCRRIDGAEYNPEIFPGLIMRLSGPKATILLFKTDKMVCAGANSGAEIIRATTQVRMMLEAGGLLRPAAPPQGPAAQTAVILSMPGRGAGGPSIKRSIKAALFKQDSTRNWEVGEGCQPLGKTGDGWEVEGVACRTYPVL